MIIQASKEFVERCGMIQRVCFIICDSGVQEMNSFKPFCGHPDFPQTKFMAKQENLCGRFHWKNIWQMILANVRFNSNSSGKGSSTGAACVINPLISSINIILTTLKRRYLSRGLVPLSQVKNIQTRVYTVMESWSTTTKPQKFRTSGPEGKNKRCIKTWLSLTW